MLTHKLLNECYWEMDSEGICCKRVYCAVHVGAGRKGGASYNRRTIYCARVCVKRRLQFRRGKIMSLEVFEAGEQSTAGD